MADNKEEFKQEPAFNNPLGGNVPSGSISSMLNNAANEIPNVPPPPPASGKPTAPADKKQPSNDAKKAAMIDNAARKAAQQRKIAEQKISKSSASKKKSMTVGILAFLLAGGAIFVLMVMMGTKDLKNQDARMNFSYGNVVAGAVAPLFEALGITQDNEDYAVASRRRMESRAGKYGELSIDDWLGISPTSMSDSGLASSSHSSYDSSSYSDEPIFDDPFSDGESTGYQRMEAGFSGGMGGGRGGSSTSGSGGNTFASSSVKNAINKNAAGRTGTSENIGSLKGGKENALRYLKNVRQTIGNGLASGSASIARGNTASVYGQGKAQGSLTGKTTGFGNGKIDQNAFNDANAVALDRIEAGDIMSLKMSSIDGKSGAVPSASVPKKVDSGLDDTKGDTPADTLAKQVLSSAGDAVGNTLKGSGGDSKGTSGGGSGASSDGVVSSNGGTPPPEITDICKDLAITEPEVVENNYDEKAKMNYTSSTVDTKEPQYRQTPKGTWIVTMEGDETRTYSDNSTKTVHYIDSYIVVPNGNPQLVSLSTMVSENGKMSFSDDFFVVTE